MRMRPHVDAAGSVKGRSGMVEEDERPHQARLCRGQRAMHAEITKINRARHDYLLDCVARSRIAEGGIFARKKAHGGALFIFAIEPQTDVTGRPILSWLEAQLCGERKNSTGEFALMANAHALEEIYRC